ncbi:MAG: hypothetical protein IT384_17120 [Deltaproteobacteria bacterium]|nr:hypothetical protein [Deltaproteobacteria bacterium]
MTGTPRERRDRSPGRGESVRAAILGVFCNVGCSGTTLEWLPIPDGPSGSHVVAVTLGGELEELAALPPGERVRARGYPPEAEIHLLAYQPSLEALGLAPGGVEPAPKCTRPCRLVAPDTSWSHPFREGEWTPAPVPTSIADRLVPDHGARCGCLPIRFESIRSDGNTRVVALVARVDGALLLKQDGSIDHVARDRQISRVCGPSGEIFAGFASAATSTVWLAGPWFGSVDLGQARPDAACPVRVGPAPLRAEPIAALDGSADGAPFELYALSSSGTFTRLDGSAWTELASLSPQEFGQNLAKVRWLAPGVAAAVYQSPEIIITSNGLARVEPVRVNVNVSSFFLESLAPSARFGIVLAAHHVGLLAQAPSGWDLVEARRTNAAGFMIEVDDHLFTAWPLGATGQLVAGREICPDTYSGFRRVNRLAIPWGPREILIAVDAAESDSESYLQVLRTEDGCS